MSTEDVFECQVRFLERELAAARETLRDRFAMAALTGAIANCETTAPVSYARSHADDCYILADAMLEARKS